MKNNKIAIICVGILAASSQLLAISNDELLKRLEQLESDKSALKKYLLDHAADSDKPAVAGK